MNLIVRLESTVLNQVQKLISSSSEFHFKVQEGNISRGNSRSILEHLALNEDIFHHTHTSVTLGHVTRNFSG